MNAVWNSYGQLCGCPEIFKKSCKFFCRELDIRVAQVMEPEMRQAGRLYGSLEPPRNLVRSGLDDPPLYPGHALDNEVRKLYVAVAAVGLGLLDVPRPVRAQDHVAPDSHDAAADVPRLEGADLPPAKRAEGG